MHPTSSGSAGCSLFNIIIMLKQNTFAQSEQKSQARAEQQKLLEAYRAVSDLMGETPPSAWEAWIRLGRQAERRLSNLKKNWLWNRI